MGETSAIPAFRAALAQAIYDTAEGAVQVSARWPGPATEAEGIYLGTDKFQQAITEIVPPNTRAARDEEVHVEVICQAWRAALAPSDGPTDDPAGVRAYELLAIVEDAIYGDVALRRTVIAAGNPLAGECVVVPFESGYAVRITAVVSGLAHLT